MLGGALRHFEAADNLVKSGTGVAYRARDPRGGRTAATERPHASPRWELAQGARR